MSASPLSFQDVRLEEYVQNWGRKKGFDANEAIVMHMEEIFQAKAIHVLDAKDDGEQLLLALSTDLWNEPKEFALMANGSFIW